MVLSSRVLEAGNHGLFHPARTFACLRRRGLPRRRHELKALAELISQNDAATQQQIVFWDAGAPSYRWIDLINQRAVAGLSLTPYGQRVYAYVAIAMNDATIATWESKYYYNRARPSELDHKLPTAVAVPNSPSYPSEHAATAWAAATVLAALLPADATAFQTMAEQAGKSRVLAGLQFPSDYEAGAELGRRVAQAVLEKAATDGSALTPSGARLTGPCNWVGTNPGNFGAQNWHPMLLTSPDQFRPPLPPDCHSAQVTQEVADVRNFPRSPAAFATNYKAFYWQSPEGLNTWVYRYADKWMFEDFARAVGKEAGDSRIWAGIHYQMDNVAGVNLGHSVAAVFIARAQQDGSQ